MATTGRTAHKEALATLLTECGQQHILEHYDELTDAEQAALFAIVKESNLKHLNRVLALSLKTLSGGANQAKASAAASSEAEKDTIEPPPAEAFFEVEKEKRMRKKATSAHPSGPTKFQKMQHAGYELIAQGKAAVLLLAGGSGTRLGVPYPKGLYTFEHEEVPANASSSDQRYLLRAYTKSLFQFHCEKIKKMEELAVAHVKSSETGSGVEEKQLNKKLPKHQAGTPSSGKPQIQLLMMTSSQNDADTRAFFVRHHFFGLQAEQVHFFTQHSLPVYAAAVQEGDVDAEGQPVHRILMENKATLCLAPGGNGGVYRSLAVPAAQPHKQLKSKEKEQKQPPSALDAAAAAGVEYVQIFSVDNLLAKIADPVFYGYTALKQCHVTVKTTPKASADERVGVFARMNGQWGVVEYTELGKERATLRRPPPTKAAPKTSEGVERKEEEEDGALLFNCANIACHCCSMPFLRFAAEKMKSETLYHAAVKRVWVNGGAEETMGVKLEAFIFDMFRYCNDEAAIAAAVAAAAAASEGTGTRKNRQTTRSTSARNARKTNEAERFGILQVDRRSEFAPIKNATETAATDNPVTAARLYLGMTTQWARAYLQEVIRHHRRNSDQAKHTSSEKKDGAEARRVARARRALACLAGKNNPKAPDCGGVWVEISPLVSYAGEGLAIYEEGLVTEVLKLKDAGKTEGGAIVLIDEKTVAQSKI